MRRTAQTARERIALQHGRDGGTNLRQSLIRLLVPLGIIVVVLFVLFLINQTAQLVSLADRVSPTLGSVVLWTLVSTYVLCVLIPLYYFFRLPPPLVPPKSETSPQFELYIQRLRRRLKQNPHLEDRPLETLDDIKAALSMLGEQADEVIRTTALQVFLVTAVSQNGSLDAVSIVVMQSKMVWRIARIYYQRPSLRQLLFLYSNVAACAIFAQQIDDIDLSEYIQPVLSSVTSGAVGALPGLQAAGGLVTNSIFSGSANAYMTLRVGVVAKLYCGSLALPDRSVVRRSAIIQATQMIPAVVRDGARKLSSAIVRAGFHSVKHASGEAFKGVRETASSLWGRLRKDASQHENKGRNS